MNIILGGTSGLGEQITKQLRADDTEVFVVGSSYEETRHGEGMAVDLKNLDDVNKLVEYIRGLGEKALDSFYWVAGYGYIGDFDKQHDALEMSLVNFAHPMPIVQAAWFRMVGQNVGNLVVVSSTTARRTRNNETSYGATKAAQAQFAVDLGEEARRLETDAKVALFMPGGMRTPFWDKNPPANYDQFLDPSKVAARIISRVTAQDEPFYEESIERGSL